MQVRGTPQPRRRHSLTLPRHACTHAPRQSMRAPTQLAEYACAHARMHALSAMATSEAWHAGCEEVVELMTWSSARRGQSGYCCATLASVRSVAGDCSEDVEVLRPEKPEYQ
eukprot:263535-Chlamydomonas_euryale.AAC.1